MAVKASRPAGVSRAAETGSSRGRALSRHRLCDVLRAHRLRHPGVCRARHGDHAGLGDGRADHGPLRPGRGADRHLAARPGAAHDARPDHRRRDRARAEPDQGRAWRHRPHALWLGDLRQPLAGDQRRRLPARGAEDARRSCSSSRATCWRRRPPTSCSKTARRRVSGTDRAIPIATLARAAYHQTHLFNGEIDPD